MLPSLKGKMSLEKAFAAADEALRQGVRGISEIITVPGIINVDFADVRSVMADAGAAFMAIGEGKGKWAAIDAARSALANPMFNAPIEGASGVLFNVSGGRNLTLGQVHEVADIIRRATKSDANVIFGVVQDRRMGKRVRITLVGTGVGTATQAQNADESSADNGAVLTNDDLERLMRGENGFSHPALTDTAKLL